MPLTFAEKVKIICKRKNITIKDLAESLGTTRQNLTNKLSRDNFPEKEMIKICNALNCSYNSIITMNDTDEQI